ncbi:hypothetical protein C4569_01890 [Candidatus Parcubacteria bacterium]|nr:MAG: hypothetical protein C4569_01890 [Candidatus Parcubacteria bacterium]
MNWIFIAAVAYLFLAAASITDKFLVSERLKPHVFAFSVAVLTGLLSTILIPFGFDWIGWPLLSVNILSGGFFLAAIFFLYKALEKKESSRIYPLTGGLQPIFIFLPAYFLLHEKWNSVSLFAFILIVCGSLLIAFSQGKEKIGRPAIYFVILAAVFFSFSLTLEKYVYSRFDSFFSVFIWNRYGMFLAGLLILLFPKSRKDIVLKFKARGHSRSSGTLAVFLCGQGAGALGVILQKYAISLGSVSMVSAMQGTMYVFLLMMTTTLSLKFPRIIKEKVTQSILLQKIVAIAFIGAGIYLLAFYK